MFKLCGPVKTVKKCDLQLPLSQDETRTQKNHNNIEYRWIESVHSPSIIQPGKRKQNYVLLCLTNKQYHLGVRMERQRIFVTVMLKDKSGTSHYELELVDHVKYWEHQLTQLGFHHEIIVPSDIPVIVAYCCIPALVDGLTSQSFIMVCILIKFVFVH